MPNLTPAHDTQHSVWHIRLNNSFGHTTWSVTNMTHKTELDMLNTQTHDVPCLGLHGTWHVAHTTQHVACKTTKPCDMHNTTHHVMTHMASDIPDTHLTHHVQHISLVYHGDHAQTVNISFEKKKQQNSVLPMEQGLPAIFTDNFILLNASGYFWST